MKRKKNKRVVVAMSGGVDSSVAAAVLKGKGHDVIGVSMQVWDYSGAQEGKSGSCCSADDIYHARNVADKLKIPFYILNFEQVFEEEVINYFMSEYLQGRTPNPCILCNQKLKFDLLLKKAIELDADYLATGHYARIIEDISTGRSLLLKGVDPLKDQSYFLFTLKQEETKRVLFPIGELFKKDVRRMARSLGLNVADKKESQEICFVVDNNYRKFIGQRMGKEECKRGNIVKRNGETLGTHNGIHLFTIGQRRGLGIPASHPYYVLGFDLKKNNVVVGEENELLSWGFICTNLNWILFSRLESTITAFCKIRYRYKETEVKITPKECNEVLVKFVSPQKAITPGQAAVFYEGDVVIGGGWIKESL